MLRMLIALFAGIVAAMVCVSGFDALSHRLYPPPADLDVKNVAALAAYAATAPFAAQAIVASGWFVAPFLGALAAIWIARDDMPGWIVAAIFLAAATMNIVLLPHPLWMVVACFVLPAAAATLAQLLLSGRTSA